MLYMNKLILENGQLIRKYSSNDLSAYNTFPMEDIDLDDNGPPVPNNSPIYKKYIHFKTKIKKNYFCCNKKKYSDI